MTVFGMHHQLGRYAEDDMNKMSVIGHISLKKISLKKIRVNRNVPITMPNKSISLVF